MPCCSGHPGIRPPLRVPRPAFLGTEGITLPPPRHHKLEDRESSAPNHQDPLILKPEAFHIAVQIWRETIKEPPGRDEIELIWFFCRYGLVLDTGVLGSCLPSCYIRASALPSAALGERGKGAFTMPRRFARKNSLGTGV